MGLLFSCCRRQKSDSHDRKPLLPKQQVHAAADHVLPAEKHLNQLADVVAALRAGKLPTQDQLARVLRVLLRSTALDPAGPQYNTQYNRTLSDLGTKAIRDLRDVLQAFLQFGLEKNDDNVLQEVVYQVSRIPVVPVHADVIVNASDSDTLDVNGVVEAIPSQEEVTSDATELINAIRNLSSILITSSTFRIILSDLFRTARELAADFAADTAHVAIAVQKSAEVVEEALRPRNDTSKRDVDSTGGAVQQENSNTASEQLEERQHQWNSSSPEFPTRAKETIISRIQQAMSQAHSNPSYRRALQDILALLRKYTEKLSNTVNVLTDTETPTIIPVIWADPPLADALARMSLLLSRMASGHPLDSWVKYLRTVVLDLFKLPMKITAQPETRGQRELQSILSDIGQWLDSALADPHFAMTSDGKQFAESLYDRSRGFWHDVSQSESPWATHFRDFVRETQEILDALANDKTTSRLLNAITSFTHSFSTCAQTLIEVVPRHLNTSQRRIRQELKRDLLEWLLPRILRSLHAIPMPRVEYRSNKLDVAVDTLYVTPTSAQLSLIPDRIRVLNWTELQLNMVEASPGSDNLVPVVEDTGMKTCTRLRVIAEGVRVSARDVGYYFCYRMAGLSSWFGWFGYGDEGLVSVDVGRRGVEGEGLNVDVELELYLDSDQDSGDQRPLFLVRDVRVDVPGLQVSLDRSKHWLLNKLLLQPLAGPIGRTAVSWVLRKQLEALLDALSQMAGKVAQEANKEAYQSGREIQINDYSRILWRILSDTSGGEHASDDDEDEADEEAPHIQTHTSVTTKGIVRTSVAFSDPEGSRTRPSSSAPIEESMLAIGVGEQILPGKGGPHEEVEQSHDTFGPTELARDALSEVQTRVDTLAEAGETVMERGAEAREGIVHATTRERLKARKERTRQGWKSEAFSI